MSTPFEVRFNPVLGMVFLVVGIANFVFSLAGGDKTGFVSGLLLGGLGVMFVIGKALVIEPAEVEVKSVLQKTIKTLPIQGWGDLELRHKVLHRRSDGQRIINLGWGIARPGDFAALRTAIDEAQP